MTRTLLPLSGSPDGLRTIADALAGGASRLSAVNTVLIGLRAGARWDSDAGHAFDAAVQAPPPVIAAVIERYAAAAHALRLLAGDLEEAQRAAGAAMDSHREGWRRHDVFLSRRDTSVDPVEQQDLERAMTAEVAIVNDAERRHAGAVRRGTDADLRCARTLRALARDTLDDPTAYTWLANTGTVSRPVALVGGLLPGPFRLVGVAGVAAGAASRVGLLAFYDEGSWKELGVDLLGSVVTTAGSVLVAGSAVGAKVVLEGSRRVFTKTANPTTGFRVGAGARTSFDDWVDGWRTRLGLPVTRTAPAVPPRVLPEPTTWGGKARTAAQRAADEAVVDGWRLATASGPAAQRMFVAGVSLQQAPRALTQVDSALDRRADRRERDARRERERER